MQKRIISFLLMAAMYTVAAAMENDTHNARSGFDMLLAAADQMSNSEKSVQRVHPETGSTLNVKRSYHNAQLQEPELKRHAIALTTQQPFHSEIDCDLSVEQSHSAPQLQESMSLRQLHSRQRKGSKAAESYLKRMYEQGSNVTFAQVCKEIFAHAEVWWFFRDMISLHKDKPQFIEDVNTVCLSEEEVTRPNVKLGCVYHAKSKLLHALVARKSYQAYKALAVVEGIDLTVKNSQRQTPEKYAESLRRKRYILPKK